MIEREILMVNGPDTIDRMSDRALRETLSVVCGELLGTGIGRAVYSVAGDPTRVVKIETAGGSFQNVLEYQTWQDLAHTKYAAYLAPCYNISSSGIALVQARVRPLPCAEDEKASGLASLLKSAKLPSFLTDFKRANYGILNGRIVCCDYGCNLLLNHGAFSSKLRKPAWRD